MSKKLIAVTVTFGFVVAVDDGAPHIDYLCREHIGDAAQDMSMDQFVVSTRRYTPGAVTEWDGQCLPYGGDGEKTTDDYLRETT